MTKRDKRETLKQYQPGVMLGEGEENRAHRVRAAAEVHSWFAEMSASERGALLTAAYKARNVSTPKRRPLPEHLRPGYVPPAAPVKPSLDELEALRVVRVQLDSDTRNALRWRQEHYDRLQALLAQGDTLRRKRIGGKVAWRTANNDTIRRDTLEKLLEAGNVAPLT